MSHILDLSNELIYDHAVALAIFGDESWLWKVHGVHTVYFKLIFACITVHDAETQKNELAEDDPLPTFDYQILEASDTLVTVEEPATHHFFIL